MNSLIKITEPRSKYAHEGFSIFSYGFRPFFLAVGGYAILALLPWVAYLADWVEISYASPKIWHSHEMIFGFVSAAISGFLLTAIPNWTGTSALIGAPLKRLFMCWLLGRVSFWLFLIFDSQFFAYLLFIDLLLPILHGIHIARIFISTNNKRNFIFIAIMASIAIANFLVILELSGIASDTAQMGIIFAVNIIMLTIAIIGGRVTPNFTRGYLKQHGVAADSIKTYPILDRLVIISLILNIVFDLFIPHSIVSYLLVLFAAFVNLIRLSRWGTLKILKAPLLWSLHLGYIWLVVALFLKAAEGWLGLPYNLYIHAFTMGSIATYILAIMSRASLGHTGRQLVAFPSIIIAFLLILVATLIRITTAIYPEFFSVGIMIVAALWVAAFLLYLRIYIPILTSPRIDGKEG